MIIIRLDRVLADRKMRLNDLAAKVGISNVNLSYLKTGKVRAVRFSTLDTICKALDCQPGDPDELLQPFSFMTHKPMHNKVDCYIAYTNPETHKVILDNLSRSPLYGGDIQGVGPRYCPSIEDKVVRFKGKERHPVFVEPCGENTEEMYLQGASSSLPEDVQNAFYRSIQGFEHIEIMRPAYAIEYDCVDPTELLPTLESKKVAGLYGAGQFNGSSGYEEAAVQGIVAGINASCAILGEEELVLPRHSSYIGTLIDDLVTKGTAEPYRIMTSRSEYRLLLRQDNADVRLTPIGRRVGLISDERWERFREKRARIEAEKTRLAKTTVAPSPALSEIMSAAGTSPITTGIKLSELVRRPELSYEALAPVDHDRPALSRDECACVQTEIKYEGYVNRQERVALRTSKLDSRAIPEDIDYDAIGGLRIEAREKLKKHRPESIGQASRISGVNPADISVLLIYLKK